MGFYVWKASTTRGFCGRELDEGKKMYERKYKGGMGGIGRM